MNSNPQKSSQQSWSAFDQQMMARALQLAKQAEYTARPNPMVGCVLVQNELIVGEGWHQKYGQPHAEVNALLLAGEQAKGSTCYVTLEPCAHTGKTGPCALALIDAGVTKVVAAMLDPNPQVAGKGFALLQNAGIEVQFGLLETQAQQLNRGFVSRFKRNRPWVTAKLAMSLDGRTALADGTSKWITGAPARADVQKLRARQDAIITGAGTLLTDNPSLNIREQDTFAEIDSWFKQAAKIGFDQPTRFLLDRNGQAQTTAKFFNNDTSVYWITNNPIKQPLDSHITQVQDIGSHLQLLNDMAKQGFNNVLLECGHRLAGQFLQQGLIDEVVVYMAPKLMGNSGFGLFDVTIASMEQTPQLNLLDVRQFGDDIRLTYEIKS